MTGGEVEKLRSYKSAIRIARKFNRTLQSRSERLETILDRHVARKAPINGEQAMIVEPLYRAIKDQFLGLEKALADAISIANY